MSRKIRSINFTCEEQLQKLITNIVDNEDNKNSEFPFWVYNITRNENGSGTFEYTA